MRIDKRERTTRRERLGREATIRAATCIPADELMAMHDQRLPEVRQAAITEHLANCAACREFLAALELPVAEPERVGRYLIRCRLGAGGMGVVYEAVDPHLDRRVAIKLVRPEHLGDDARRRLLREARALAKISHPNVVTVHDVGEHDQQVFVATELVEGETMAIWQVGRDWRVLIDAWIQVARGLSAAHAGGIVHRDVKPSNVFVGRDGRVRIGDFGIARDYASDATELSTGHVGTIGQLTVTGAVSGTPGYMAPEQLRGLVDARSDQFALCVAIVEGLVGARPEAGMAPLLPGLPAALRDALIRGLAVDPSVRFATMADLADALLGALYSQVPRAARGWWWIAIPVAIAGAAITGGVAALVTHSNARGVPAAPVEVSAPKQEAAAKVVTPSTDGAIVQSASADPSHRVPDATIRSEAGNSAEGSVADPRLDTAAGAGTSHESRATSKPSGLRRISAEAPSAEEALKLLKQATDFERAGHWDEARTAWQRLEKVKDYRSEAMYHQAWAAFQVNDLAAAAKLTRQGASESGPYQTQAKFLLGDTLYRQGDYKHAKEYYLALHVEVRGDDRAIAMKKVAACNKMLRLPDDDGIRHN